MQDISAIVLAKNDQKTISNCLKSLDWCNEIIIIDDNSSDGTVEIAKKLGATVYEHHLEDFSSQRNYAMTKAANNWLLFIDADEVVSGALAFEVASVISNLANGIENECAGFYIPRIDIIWGKKLKHGNSGVMLLRLARKGAGEWKGLVHEEWKISGKVGRLKNPIIHYPHQTIAEFLREINFYSTLRAKELYAEQTKTNIALVALFPLGKFVINYFVKMGLLDGIPGLVLALIMSFHSFMVRAKLWIMWNRK